MFLTFIPSIVQSVLFGLSIFMMKEDDMALTSRSHKATYQAPGTAAQELWSFADTIIDFITYYIFGYYEFLFFSISNEKWAEKLKWMENFTSVL